MKTTHADLSARYLGMLDYNSREIVDRFAKLRPTSKAKWWAAAAVVKACLLDYEAKGFGDGFHLALDLMKDWREPTEAEKRRLLGYIAWLSFQRAHKGISSRCGSNAQFGLQIWELCCRAVIDTDIWPIVSEVCTSAANASPEKSDRVFMELLDRLPDKLIVQSAMEARRNLIPQAFLFNMNASLLMVWTLRDMGYDAEDEEDGAETISRENL